MLTPQQAKRETIINFMDLAGMVTVDRKPGPETTKNGLMHLGLFMCFYKALGILDYSDASCFYDTVKSCEEVPGDYDRYPAYGDKPRNNDANAHDDYTGVFSGSVVTGQRFHKDILEHGIKYLFIYNNQKPGLLIDDINPLKWEWWAFRLRFLDHIAWYYLGNGRLRILSPLLMAWLAVKTLSSKPGSGKLLDYMFVESLAQSKWEWKKFRKWFLPRSMLVESATDYFHDGHPAIDLAKEVVKS